MRTAVVGLVLAVGTTAALADGMKKTGTQIIGECAPLRRTAIDLTRPMSGTKARVGFGAERRRASHVVTSDRFGSRADGRGGY